LALEVEPRGGAVQLPTARRRLAAGGAPGALVCRARRHQSRQRDASAARGRAQHILDDTTADATADVAADALADARVHARADTISNARANAGTLAAADAAAAHTAQPILAR
jgi:hypothetical protein